MLELQNVTGGYGDTTVLRDVSISCPTRRWSRCSARTAPARPPRCAWRPGCAPAARLRRARRRRHHRLGPYQRVRRGPVPHPGGRGIFPSLTVRENLILDVGQGQGKRGVSNARSRRSRCSAPGRRQIAGTLSGGEQQMLALVRAYVANPKVVLVDEASLGLAPLVVDSIFEFLEKTRRPRAWRCCSWSSTSAARSRWRAPCTS